jgi:hypothetical protein
MAAVEFEIGKAFPAPDPVARFITVLAMMSNDWTRLAKQTLSIEDFYDDAEGLRILWFRHQVSLLFEAAEFIRDTQHRFPAVETFVASLPAKARRDRDRVVGAVDPKPKKYRGKWVEGLRNVTFHYPEMHPEKAKHGKEEAFEALTNAAELTSTIDAGDVYFSEARFHFADEVVVQWVPEKGSRRALRDLAGDATALARFVQEAAMAYIERTEAERPGTFTVT